MQECSQAAALTASGPRERSAQRPLAGLITRGGTDVNTLRRAEPLPETAIELCAVARGLGAPDSAVYLGSRATVTQVKALSADGRLARAKVVHFATHGLIAAEAALFASGRAEPALLLTPPEQYKEGDADDGLLKVSDVMQLKLDADWVVMSACNTAAGGADGAEALSGLARAFFYAGARALLVSHWYVDSNAAVSITTGAAAALRDAPEIGRAEALRRSLAALTAKGGTSAHPANWAPFVLVGEGGRP